MTPPEEFQAFRVPPDAPLRRPPAYEVFRVPPKNGVIAILEDDNVIVIEN